MSNDKNKNKPNKQRDITKNTKDEEIKEDDVVSKDENNEEKIISLKNIKKKKIYAVAAFICVVLGFAYFSAKRYDDLVYPNVKLYDEDISKLNKDELKSKIIDKQNFIANNTISINIENKKYELRVGDFVKVENTEKTQSDILNFGKDSNFLSQFGLITLGVDRDYELNYKIDEKSLNNKINQIYKDSKVDTVEPNITIVNEKLSITEGKDGKVINKKELNSKIIDAINSDEIGKTTVVIDQSYEKLSPKIDVADLEKVDSKISSATTYYGGTGYNRGLNIATAAGKINDTLLMPGDEFSYEEAVSPVELYNGYYMAPVIVNGTHKDAPGGGVCQVSSTLYNAQLKAGILPTERFNHSKSVSYVQKGLDATLATDLKDLKFKNPYEYPVLIRAYTVEGQITVEFWSNSSVIKGKKFTPVSFVSGNVAKAYLYEYNSKGELIKKTYIDTSIYG